MALIRTHIPEFAKPVKQLLSLSKQTSKAVTFSRFERADKCVDAVIISRTKSEYPNYTIDKVGEIRLISSFTYFPLLFLDADLAEYYFYPAKTCDAGFEYDDKVFLPLENGRNMRAEYSIDLFNPFPAPVKKDTGFHLFPQKPQPPRPPEYQRCHVHIESANKNISADDFWYKVVKNDNAPRPKSVTGKRTYTQEDVRYPIPPFRLNDSTGKYESDFDVFIKPGKETLKPQEIVAMRYDDTRVTLTSSERGINTDYGTKSIPAKASKSGKTYPIYCTYEDCLEEIKPIERLARLSPPVDVIDIIAAFNAKKEGFVHVPKDERGAPGNIPEPIVSAGVLSDDDDYYADDDVKEPEVIESTPALAPENIEIDEDEQALIDFKNTLNAKDRDLLENDETLFLEVREILYENSFEPADLRKTLKLLFYYSQALWKKRTGEYKFGNIDSYDDTNIISLSSDNFFDSNEANKLVDVRDRHGSLVEEFLCPYCYETERRDEDGKPRLLIRNHGVNETVFISLLGATSAGKTVYLAKTMYSYFTETHPINDGLVAIPSSETKKYLTKVLNELSTGNKIVATSGIQRLTYEITFRRETKNVVIYDIPGETLFSDSDANRLIRRKLIRNIYNRAAIVLFIFSIDHADVPGAIKRPTGVPIFLDLMEKINQQVFENAGFEGKNTAFILSKVDKLSPDYYGSDILIDALPNPDNIINETVGLDGIETSLDFYTAYSRGDAYGKARAIENVLRKENELTEKFFRNVLIKDHNYIKVKFTSDQTPPRYFSYGTPDGDVNNKDSVIPAVRPFNSIQWIIGNLFPPEDL